MCVKEIYFLREDYICFKSARGGGVKLLSAFCYFRCKSEAIYGEGGGGVNKSIAKKANLFFYVLPKLKLIPGLGSSLTDHLNFLLAKNCGAN